MLQCIFGILLCGFLWFVCLKHAKQNRYCIVSNNYTTTTTNNNCIILYITANNCGWGLSWEARLYINSTLTIFTSSRVGVVLVKCHEGHMDALRKQLSRATFSHVLVLFRLKSNRSRERYVSADIFSSCWQHWTWFPDDFFPTRSYPNPSPILIDNYTINNSPITLTHRTFPE